MGTFMGIDLGAMSLQDALDLAVLIEDEAKDRYDELANQLELHRTPEAARFFRFMAANEEKHRLELATRRQAMFGNKPSRVGRGMLFEVEAPEYDEVRAFMTPRAALQVAYRAETKAHGFFDEALGHIQDPGVKALFSELREEEVQHQRLILAELERTPPDSKVPGDGAEDEPVAQ